MPTQAGPGKGPRHLRIGGYIVTMIKMAIVMNLIIVRITIMIVIITINTLINTILWRGVVSRC